MPHYAPDENRVDVRLTHAFAIEEKETTWAAWQTAGMAKAPGSTTDENGSTVTDCDGSDCPAGNLSWFDAIDYANKRSERDNLAACYELIECQRESGSITACADVRIAAKTVCDCKGYRLPTDAEWEAAARSGTTTTYYSGDAAADASDPSYFYLEDSTLDPIAWYVANARPKPYPAVVAFSTRPGGLKQPNAFGLYDALGNAAEWTSDAYNNVPRTEVVDPGGALAPLSFQRSLRGGSAYWPFLLCRASLRFAQPPSFRAPGYGVRLARTL